MKNFIGKNFTIALIFSTCLAQIPAMAKSIPINDQRCVSIALEKIEKTVLGYDDYRDVPGALMKVEFPGFGSLKLIEMIKSQGRFLKQDSTQTDAIAWFVLRPVNIEDGKLYPRFLLSCQSTSSQEANRRFSQTCKMVLNKEHYGLDGFDSHFTAKANSPLCGAGQTHVQFNATLISNSDHVTAIKKKVLAPAGVLAPLLEPLFDEVTFFKSYYESVYEGWIKSGGL